MRTLIVIVAVALVALGITWGVMSEHHKETPAGPARVAYGHLDADGLKEIKETSGGKHLVVHLWASWCPHCVAEFPDFVKFFKKNKLDDARVVAISFDRDETIKDYEKLLRKHRPSFENFHGRFHDLEALKELTDPAWEGGIPATFLFDENRKLVFSHSGILDFDEFLKAFEKSSNK